MRYLPWFILAYLVLGLQCGLSPYIAFHNAPPNLVMPAAIFIALYAPRDAALLGTYVLGLMQDMLSQEPLGVHALLYSAVTLAVRFTQPRFYREHWMTHLLMGLIGGVTQGLILTLVSLRLPPRPTFSLLLISAIYSTLLTPVLLLPLQKIKWIFGFKPERRTPGRL